MTYEELLAENIRLRTRIRELEQENARLKGSGSSLLCEPEPPQYGSGPVRLERDRNTEIQRRLDIFRGLFRGREAEQQRRFELRQAKKKEKHRGINVHFIPVIVHIGELYQN